jgi:hypothetical protein
MLRRPNFQRTEVVAPREEEKCEILCAKKKKKLQPPKPLFPAVCIRILARQQETNPVFRIRGRVTTITKETTHACGTVGQVENP